MSKRRGNKRVGLLREGQVGIETSGGGSTRKSRKRDRRDGGAYTSLTKGSPLPFFLSEPEE